MEKRKNPIVNNFIIVFLNLLKIQGTAFKCTLKYTQLLIHAYKCKNLYNENSWLNTQSNVNIFRRIDLLPQIQSKLWL